MAERPNILLVVIDCARADKWLGTGRTTVTPNLDRLCREGGAFPTTITEKACTTPCFASLLSGCFSPRHGVHLVWGYRFPKSAPLLTERLADAGYHTYAEVSGPLLAEMGLDRGFERYTYRAPCDYLHTAWGDQFIERLKRGDYSSPWFILLHLWELHPQRRVSVDQDSAHFGADEYERAVSSLDAQLGRLFEAAGPNTLIIVTGDHGEKTRTDRFPSGGAVDYTRKALGIDDACGMAPASVAHWAGPSMLQAFYGVSAPRMRDLTLAELRAPNRFSRWSRLRDRLRLLRLTPFVLLSDIFALGAPLKLTRMLERRGLLDPRRAERRMNQFRAALGDAELLQMHMRMWIRSYRLNADEGHIIHVYDMLTRVPLALRWRGHVPAGFSSDRLIRQVDILPTLLDLLEIDLPETDEIDGRSFAPLLRGEPWEALPAYQSVTGLPADLEIRGVRTETHRYTFGPNNPDLPDELYDLIVDPKEQRNLAADAPDLCAELRELANSFVPSEGERQAEVMALTPAAGDDVEQRMRGLGYLD